MRNPDEWTPQEPDEPEDPEDPEDPEEDPSGTRHGALVGLVLVVLLVVGGLVLTHVLHSMARFQDCILSGRSDCK
jgi:hypothetical protein